MDLTQILGIVSIFSTCGAAFSTGIAVALWGQRNNSAQVPVILQRLGTIEKSLDLLTAHVQRVQVGQTHFTDNSGG